MDTPRDGIIMFKQGYLKYPGYYTNLFGEPYLVYSMKSVANDSATPLTELIEMSLKQPCYDIICMDYEDNQLMGDSWVLFIRLDTLRMFCDPKDIYQLVDEGNISPLTRVTFADAVS